MNHPVRAVANHVIFQFEDRFSMKTVEGRREKHFVEETTWGFEVVKTEDTLQNARWGIVISVGPKCDPQIEEGMRILIEPLKWTNGVEFEDNWYWRTNDENVLAIDENFNINEVN